jgi:hypothetical protein
VANTKSSLETAFKYVQKNTLNDLKPNSAILQDLAGPLKGADQLGRKFLWPVCLSYELGITFGDGTAFSYNDDVAGVYEEIEIDPNPVVLKSRISIEAADRMAKSDKAVINHVALRSGQMKMSLVKVAEVDSLYGRSAVGIGVAASTSNIGATIEDITFTAATWAPGIWAGMEGAKLEARAAGVLVNTNADLVISQVNFDTKTVRVTGNNTDIAALGANDVYFFKGAYANGQYGLHYQLDESGTVFGINNSTYGLWKGNEYAVGGALTLAKVLKGAARAVGKGGLDEDCVLLTSPTTWEGLNSDMAALRSQDSSYKPSKSEIGSKAITYNAQFGAIDIVAHPYCMEGFSYLMPKTALRKVGATDITFGVPGKDGEVFEVLEAVAAYQMTGRYSYQMLIPQPAKCVLFTGIVNS